MTGASGAWSVDLHRSAGPRGRRARARWLRRGLAGTLVGLGAGVTALALNLPAGDASGTPLPGAGRRPVGPEQHTEVVPPVVRTVTVGTPPPLRAGRNALTAPDDPPGGRAGPTGNGRPPATADAVFARPAGQTGPFADVPDRLAPRPVAAPQPRAEQQAAFGRPATVAGGFAGGRPLPPARPVPPPPARGCCCGRSAAAPADGACRTRPAGAPAGGAPRPARGGSPTPAAIRGATRTRRPAWARRPSTTTRPGAARARSWSTPRAARSSGCATCRSGCRPWSLLAVLLVGAARRRGRLVPDAQANAETPLLAPGTQLSEVDPGITPPAGLGVRHRRRASRPAVVSIEVRVGQAGATGSGVVIEGDNGYIVTNNHVVSGADGVEGAEIRAVFSDGSGSAARIVGRDPASDIAVLKVEKPGLVTAALGNSDERRRRRPRRRHRLPARAWPAPSPAASSARSTGPCGWPARAATPTP